MKSVDTDSGVVELYELVADTVRRGREASVTVRVRRLQALVDAIAAREAGRYPRQPRPPEDGALIVEEFREAVTVPGPQEPAGPGAR